MPTDAYATAVAAYLKERADADAEIRAAVAAYRSEAGRLAATVAAARSARDEAERAAEEAAALVTETDTAVALLWRSLGDFIGHRRTGPTPPAGEPDPDPGPERVRARLERSGRLLSLARLGELPIEAPRHTEVTAAVIGAGTGALAVAAALWMLGSGDTAVRQAVAAVTLFMGVVTGPVVLGVWLSWQYRVRPRPAQTLACLGAAIAAVCALAALFMRGLLHPIRSTNPGVGRLTRWGTPDASTKREESRQWPPTTTPARGTTVPCRPLTTPPPGSTGSSRTAGSPGSRRSRSTATR
jgi:hypothetical protein